MLLLQVLKELISFKADVLACFIYWRYDPGCFSALAMQSVGKAAMDMVNEVRRQFREIPGIMEGTGQPEYGKCVDISTKAALREMMLPGAITIITPIILGFLWEQKLLGGYMAEFVYRVFMGHFPKTTQVVHGIMLKNLLKQV